MQSRPVDRFVWFPTAVWRALHLRVLIMDIYVRPGSLTFVIDSRYTDFLLDQTRGCILKSKNVVLFPGLKNIFKNG